MINDENTTSISKDCFFFPATKKKSFNNKAVKNEMDKERKKLCNEVWGEMETIVNTLHDELQGDLFQQLLAFIQGRNHQAAATTSQIKISTAVLITGVNMPDHKSLFTSLNNNISKKVSPYVVSLQSRQSINMKTLMKSFGTQLAASLKNDDERSEFEKRGAMVTMSAIEEWYLKNVDEKRSKSPTKKGVSPSKRRKITTSKQPIVVIFEDFEAFPRKLLHDFILTSSFHTSKLELVFIFGVSTSWEEVSQRLLSHSSIVHLDIVKFQAPAPSRHLSFIFDKILLTDEYPFKLSGKCLQLSLDVFLRYDFSISNFIRSLKFCVLEHFRKQPASIICQMNVEKAASLINCMKYEDLKIFANLTSIRKYFASMDEAKAKEIKSNRNLLKKELMKLVCAIYSYHDNYFVTMKCLHVMTRHLPNLPMGKQIREIFCACHRKPLGELPQFREAFLYLRVSSRDQLSKYFTSCINIIDDHLEHVGTSPKQEDPHSPEHYRAELVRYLAILSSDDSDLDYYDSDEYEEAEKAVEEMSKVKYTYQLQQRLREKRAAKTTNKRKTKFEKLREEALLRSRDFFEHNLRPPVNMELYEVFYFDSPQTMKERLISSPRLNIETALSDPYYYIKVKELDNCAYISSSFPDVSIAYKLHLESGSLINLYDWLKAFHVIVTSEYNGDDKNDDIDETTQARFVQAVSELQLMGFIKPTKKKIDHMQRLTWS